MFNFIRSFGFAAKGIRAAAAQRNFRVQVLCAILVCCLGVALEISSGDWCIILLCIGLVLSLEVMNSAIERIVDLVSPQRSEAAGKIKDLAAGAVLIASCISAVIAMLIFRNYILLLAF